MAKAKNTVKDIKLPASAYNMFGAIKKINDDIVFSDIHLLVGGIPAVILPIFGFIAACI